eukprot:2252898-Prymnesium_polylepis.1
MRARLRECDPDELGEPLQHRLVGAQPVIGQPSVRQHPHAAHDAHRGRKLKAQSRRQQLVPRRAQLVRLLPPLQRQELERTRRRGATRRHDRRR